MKIKSTILTCVFAFLLCWRSSGMCAAHEFDTYAQCEAVRIQADASEMRVCREAQS